jgi:hypothetical protein
MTGSSSGPNETALEAAYTNSMKVKTVASWIVSEAEKVGGGRLHRSVTTDQRRPRADLKRPGVAQSVP